MVMLVGGLGKQRLVTALRPADFAALKTKLAKRNGPARMGTIIQVIRCAFRYAYESELLDRPARFGPAFKRPGKKVLRLQRAKQGPKLFSAEEVRRMLGAAGVHLRAMILLGINAGLGNEDVGRLPLSALDLDCSILDFPRPKTGIKRRCVLWPETVAALQASLAERPKPKDPDDADLVFITQKGNPWAKGATFNPICAEIKKLLAKVGITGRLRLGFYAFRHTFRTIADEAKDQPAADFVMGHESPHMSSVYRERISDERLQAVAEHVRTWLFPPTITGADKTSDLSPSAEEK
jgi:integrase